MVAAPIVVFDAGRRPRFGRDGRAVPTRGCRGVGHPDPPPADQPASRSSPGSSARRQGELLPVTTDATPHRDVRGADVAAAAEQVSVQVLD
ncbi:MAG: hypothetical protein R2705_12475 [Ilumatobacteraceae bacterium]